MADYPQDCTHRDLTPLGQVGVPRDVGSRLVIHPDGALDLADYTAAAYFARCEVCGRVVSSVALYAPDGTERHTGFHLFNGAEEGAYGD
jgi:hypothetical protein